jgi:hypothetical protein
MMPVEVLFISPCSRTYRTTSVEVWSSQIVQYKACEERVTQSATRATSEQLRSNLAERGVPATCTPYLHHIELYVWMEHRRAAGRESLSVRNLLLINDSQY